MPVRSPGVRQPADLRPAATRSSAAAAPEMLPQARTNRRPSAGPARTGGLHPGQSGLGHRSGSWTHPGCLTGRAVVSLCRPSSPGRRPTRWAPRHPRTRRLNARWAGPDRSRRPPRRVGARRQGRRCRRALGRVGGEWRQRRRSGQVGKRERLRRWGRRGLALSALLSAVAAPREFRRPAVPGVRLPLIRQA